MDIDDDQDCFRSAMDNIKPLHTDRAPPPAKKPPPVARFTRRDQRAVLNESLHGPDQILENGDEIEYCRMGLHHPVLKKLKRGKFTVDEELDLHGLNVAQAKQAMADFLREANFYRWSSVRIIHGKGTRSFQGRPVLRPKVTKWLCTTVTVIAFCSARPTDGGTGALYVLLGD